jgi:hypothetical protein
MEMGLEGVNALLSNERWKILKNQESFIQKPAGTECFLQRLEPLRTPAFWWPWLCPTWDSANGVQASALAESPSLRLFTSQTSFPPWQLSSVNSVMLNEDTCNSWVQKKN